MANSGRILSGLNPRLLQYGLDKIIDHFSNLAETVTDRIFQSEDADKGFYEIVTLAGMGPAGVRGESDSLTYDSINQESNPRFTIFTYEKSARISMEAVEDNVYKNMVKLIGQSFAKAHKDNEDYQGAGIFNSATNSGITWGDGVSLLNTAHPTQAGPTYSNRPSPDLDLSEDSVEQAVILVYTFRNPDGLLADYKTQQLIVPVPLMYEAQRIYGSKYRTSRADNDINAVMNRGDIVEEPIVWKRLTATTTWFLTTDAPNGLIMANRKGLTSKMADDIYTYDQIYTSHKRFRTLVGDSRCLVGSVGP